MTSSLASRSTGSSMRQLERQGPCSGRCSLPTEYTVAMKLALVSQNRHSTIRAEIANAVVDYGSNRTVRAAVGITAGLQDVSFCSGH